uniref:Clc-like protein n=1 Tax=Heterorhabditis bacteriophora TaxID=37862 RepID=A0A1I7XKD9_HETBA
MDLEDDNSPVGEVNRHKFYGWHTATLILLALALLTSFLSTCLGMCACCYGSSLSLVFTAITLLTTFLSSVAEGIFFFYSHRADNRFIKGIVGTYEQRVGLAFFLQMAAAFFHFFSFLVAMLFTYFSFSGTKDASDHYSIQRSSRTNVTNIGRSMEFDTPLMYPPTQPNIRPPYSKQEEYDRHVAESMPELGRSVKTKLQIVFQVHPDHPTHVQRIFKVEGRPQFPVVVKMDNGVSKCGRKTALSIFFAISIIAFTFCLLSLLSPSWQYVYLENGRTEHQHGLWLDCKRDYSFDYGRTREYYETLYRREFQGSPFDIFFLPPLQCVYKFDYYIDPEDLYDHDHDENRIQNDAYQHLFLAILSTIGIIVFYMWANYQDNKVIKEEADTIYEQVLGWAFYFQVIGAILQWLTSMLGCCVTSISFSKTRAKLVKIEKNFERTASMPNFCKKQSKGNQKRDQQIAKSNTDVFSSVSNITETTHSGNNGNTTSPKDLYLLGSSTNLEAHRTPMVSHAARSAEHPGKLKSALKTPQQQRRPLNDSDVTYEYIPCSGSVGISTFLGVNPECPRTPSQNIVYDSVYDQIGQDDYLEPNSIRAKSSSSTLNIENVLLPTMPLTGSSQSIPVPNQKTTIINDIGRPSSSSDLLRNNQINLMEIEEQHTIDERIRQERLKKQKLRAGDKDLLKPTIKQPAPLQSTELQLSIRDFGINLSNSQNGYCTEMIPSKHCEEPHLQRYEQEPSTSVALSDSSTSVKYSKLEKTVTTRPNTEVTSKYMKIDRSKMVNIDIKNGLDDRLHDNTRLHSSQDTDTRDPSQFFYHELERNSSGVSSPPKIAINTFGFTGRSSQRSITNLSFYPAISNAAEVFERPNSDLISLSASSNSSKKPQTQQNQKKLLVSLPDEVDRSVGSSTLLENDVRDLSMSYANDAELRLNLFMNDRGKTQDETTV